MKNNKNKINRTTKIHFELFKKECDKWIEHFGLKGWSVYYAHEKADGVRACVGWKLIGRVATITLNTDWENCIVTEGDVKKAAFHEVCELLLSRIRMMADDDIGNSKNAVEEETHNIIRILENTVFNESLHKL